MNEEDYTDITDELEDDGSILEEDTEEVEEEEEVEASEEDQEVEEEEEVVKQPKIPKARLDAAINQAKAERARAEWLEAQLEKLIESNTKAKATVEAPAVPSFDFDSAEEEYATAIVEGEIAKAAKIRSRIDNARQAEFRALISQIQTSTEKKTAEQSKAVAEETRFASAIAQMESKYPFLDADSDDFNEEAVDTVNALLNGLRAKGMAKDAALREAVRKVAPLYIQPEPKKSLGTQRKVEAAKKSAKAAASQPISTKSKVSEIIKKEGFDIAKLSDKDFAKLSPSELKILRGD